MQCLNGEQVNIKDSVLRANISQRLDDDAARARAEQLADMGKSHIDLVSDDEDFHGQGAKRSRSCGEAHCDEDAPTEKSEVRQGGWILAPKWLPRLGRTTVVHCGETKAKNHANSRPKAKANAVCVDKAKGVTVKAATNRRRDCKGRPIAVIPPEV